MAGLLEDGHRHRGWLEAEAELGAVRERLRDAERRLRAQAETIDRQRCAIER